MINFKGVIMENLYKADKHNYFNTFIFHLKCRILIFKRLISNIFNPIKYHKYSNELINSNVIAESISELWNSNDNAKNWILTAGKIENLRIASKLLNGLVINENEIF